MALPGKNDIDMKKLIGSVIFDGKTIGVVDKIELLNILDKQPDQKLVTEFVFPDHPIFPRKPLVFDDAECFVGPGDFKLTDLTVKIEVGQVVHDWLDRLISDVRAYSAAREVRQAVASYAEENQITDFAARILFKVWLFRLTVRGVGLKYAGESVAANVEYFWRQPDCWCWLFADGYSPRDAINEDASAAY